MGDRCVEGIEANPLDEDEPPNFEMMRLFINQSPARTYRLTIEVGPRTTADGGIQARIVFRVPPDADFEPERESLGGRVRRFETRCKSFAGITTCTRDLSSVEGWLQLANSNIDD